MLSKKAQGPVNRTAVYKTLGKRPKTIGEIAEALNLKYVTARRHLKNFVKMGAVREERQGRVLTYARIA